MVPGALPVPLARGARRPGGLTVSKNLDNVLAALDVGLQSSPERGISTDHAPGQCARCQNAFPVKDGDLCAGCRAFLLGDSSTDPKRTQWLDNLRDALVSATATFTPSDVHEFGTIRITSLAPDGSLLPEGRLAVAGYLSVEVDTSALSERLRAVGTSMERAGMAAVAWAPIAAAQVAIREASEAERRRAQADAIALAMHVCADWVQSALDAIWEGCVAAVSGVHDWMNEAGLLEPTETARERRAREAREHELAALDRHRRSHRRTNRWGPPPGRAS